MKRIPGTPLKWVLTLIILIAIAAAGLTYRQVDKAQNGGAASFDECAAEGNPILESYPAQCTAKNGKHFVQPTPEGQVLIDPTI